ncbi:rhodanese-like domain-containing protein [Tateyamaria sp.]|uniref:rhodanese-like domain-containing protein n=1 Tax=Tateyamaria sp. TaxID=1929288 RepID=UPI003B2196E4
MMDPDFCFHPNDLMRVMGTGQMPCLIDVCVPEDIAAAPWRLPGARHVAHGDIREWMQTADPARPVVVICQKGLKLSHGAAALLRARGFHARALEGGNLGWFDAKRPRLALNTGSAGIASWVLPAPVTAQSLCLAWLIHRWFDDGAEIMWVPAAMVGDVAARFGAQPAPRRIETLCSQAGLDYVPLVTFLSQIDGNAAPWLPLLTALPHLHHSSEAQAAAALSIIDAAWVAAREGAA